MASVYTYNHNTIVDGETRYGKAVGFPRRCLVGAAWQVWDEGYSGSRTFNPLWVTTRSGGDISNINTI